MALLHIYMECPNKRQNYLDYIKILPLIFPLVFWVVLNCHHCACLQGTSCPNSFLSVILIIQFIFPQLSFIFPGFMSVCLSRNCLEFACSWATIKLFRFERERTCPLCRVLVKPAGLRSFSDGSTTLFFQLFWFLHWRD